LPLAKPTGNYRYRINMEKIWVLHQTFIRLMPSLESN
jgi:hypothetical protein